MHACSSLRLPHEVLAREPDRRLGRCLVMRTYCVSSITLSGCILQLDHMVSDAQKVYTGLYAERMAAFVATGDKAECG